MKYCEMCFENMEAGEEAKGERVRGGGIRREKSIREGGR